MALVINFAGASLRKPGAYSRIKVAQGEAAAAQLGVLALVGEAEQGDSFANETSIDAVRFSPDQFADIKAKYGSGPLVDAARLALAPSVDPQIAGGAQFLYLLKTNASTKAQLTLPTAYGTVRAVKAGAAGNSISATVAVAASQAVITIADAVSGDSVVSSSLGNHPSIQIQVTDGVSTAASLTISATAITVTVTGGTAPSLSIPIGQFSTIQKLVDFIDAQTNYTCTVVDSLDKNLPPSILDRVSAIDVLTTAYSVKKDAYEVRKFFETEVSDIVQFIPTVYVGLPTTLAKTFLTTGAKGASTNASIQACVDALAKARINFFVPLFSRDASSDITDGLTDASSTYTIDSIHAMAKSHCAQYSTVKGRKERQAWVGYKGTYTVSKEKSAGLGSARVGMTFQDVDVVDSTGASITAQPHMLAVIAAAMKCAAVVGLPNTFKLANVNGFSHATFDPETQADDAIDANLAFLEKAPGGGFRFVLDNSTYGQVADAWIYNRPSVIYAADVAAYAIRLNTETFVGRRNSDVSSETIKNLLVSVMDGLRSSGIIVPDANTGGKGFKDLVVRINGSVVNVSVTLALVEGIEFILNDITVQRAVA